MTTRLILRTLACLALIAGFAAPVCLAAETASDDIDANRREGARIFLQSCHPCHGLKYMRLQSLKDLGFTEADIGTMLPGSRFDTPLHPLIGPDDAEVIYGLAPPDLSLIVKAREGGKEHVFSLLTNYRLDPDQKVENTWLPGVRMPDVFSYAMANDAQWREELQRRAHRVADFLDWVADPKVDERHRLGYFVIAYLLVLTTLLYFVKRRVWSRVPH